MPWSALGARIEHTYLGRYHTGFSEQVLVCHLGRSDLPGKLRAGHKLGLGAWGRPLLDLLLSLRPWGTAEAQGYSWLL